MNLNFTFPCVTQVTHKNSSTSPNDLNHGLKEAVVSGQVYVIKIASHIFKPQQHLHTTYFEHFALALCILVRHNYAIWH